MRAGGPFNPATGRESVFRISLFDNPGGVANTGVGAALDFVEGTTTESAAQVIDFTKVTHTFDASGVTNGNIVLQIDLIAAFPFEYAGFDNLEVSVVPVPAAWGFLVAGLALLRVVRRR
ncbi:MAG: hypothetical protein AAF387_20880 [Pseudomonadota bacterium]